MKMKTALSVLAAAVAAVLSHTAVAADEAASGASAPKTRAERKAETMKARKEGALTPAGETAPEAEAAAAASAPKSTKTRAERKAETKKAREEGKLAPAGEGTPK